MTYIIAEPCIDIKDKSCVDVCPVDCIHEAERILVIDPEECIDCFAPSERLITSWGVRSFEELEDRACRVLRTAASNCNRQAIRRRPLVKVTLAPLSRSGPDTAACVSPLATAPVQASRHATPRTAGCSPMETNGSLSPGQFVPAMRALPKRDSETYRLGVLHGLVFGDGRWNKQEIRSGEHLHYVQLYGEKVAKFKDFFDQVNFSPCLDVHPGYAGTGVVRSSANLKRLLPEDADPEYITGFVDGWLASDGDQTKAGSIRLRSIDHEALSWLEGAAPLAGYVTVGSGEEANRETNFGVRSRPIRWLYLATRDVSWRVMQVERHDSDDSETFCAVVPGKHEVTAAGGIYTRNCVRASQSARWRRSSRRTRTRQVGAFVKINYAYGEGFDVVNKLTDEYATEHNVQNHPGITSR